MLLRKPDVDKLEAKHDIGGLSKALGYNPEKDWRVGARAAQALGEIGDPGASEALIRAMTGGNHHAETAAAKALARIRDAPRAEPLEADARETIRAGLIHALGEQGPMAPAAAAALAGDDDARAIEALIGALGDNRSTDVRLAATKALGATGGERAVDALSHAAPSEQDPGVRAEAVAALAKAGGARAVEKLSELAIGDRDPQVRKTADEAVCALGDDQAINAMHKRAETAQYEREGNQAIRALAGSASPAARLAGVETLRRHGGAPAAKALTGALHDDDADVRKAAAEAIKAIGNDRELADLCSSEIRTLRNDNKDVRARRQAVDVLEALGGEKAMEALTTAALHAENPQVSAAATNAVQMAGGGSEMEAQRKREVREARVQRERKVHEAVALREQQIEEAIRTLGTGSAQARARSAATLGKLEVRRASALGALITAALHDEDGKVRIEAAEALRTINDRRAVKALVRELHSPEDTVRRRAAQILHASQVAPGANAALDALLAGDVELRREIRTECSDGQHIPDSRCICTKCGLDVHDPDRRCVCRRCGARHHDFLYGVVGGGYHNICSRCGALRHVHTGGISGERD